MAGAAAVAGEELVKFSQVIVGSWPTDWFSVTPPHGDDTQKTITLIIPGNPGIVRYYTQFCLDLYLELHQQSAVWAISHTCHSENDAIPNTTVEREVEHKVMFIKKFVPRGCKLRLVGHSIGCQMILKSLDELIEHSNTSDPPNGPELAAPQFTLGQSYMLFPTIERMKETPQGRYVWPVLAYFWWIPPFIGSCLSILPVSVKEKLVHMCLYDGSGLRLRQHVIDSAVSNVRPDMMRNMLDLAHNELLTVTELDAAAITRHKSRLVFYYGSQDSWCPVEFREQLIQRVPGVVAYLCQKGINHAFVVRMSTLMASELGNIIREVEELEMVQDSG
uniref:Lipid droplet-associated hydrolase n=2 Tax=Hirondellea gigas TaxID=1518452 RepID=A0A6A7G0C4_9CRUS